MSSVPTEGQARALSAQLVDTRRVRRFSVPIVTGVVCFLDFILLFISAWLAAMALDARGQVLSQSLTALAGTIGAGMGCIVLGIQHAYTFDRLRSSWPQIRPIIKAVVLSVGAVIACLFLVNAETRPLRVFPFTSGAIALFLLASFRFGVRALILSWSKAGRFRRRIAVVAVSEFSQKFIERLQTESDEFEIAGVYDDRIRSGRVPPLHANVPVRGCVAKLVHDSREENFDLIVVALPLSAVDRISAVLEQLRSTVADVCLTTDLAGLTYRGDQFDSVGSNPTISVGEIPLKDWQAVKKAAFDYFVGGIALLILSPLLALFALAIRLDSKGPILFRQPRLGFNNRMFICYKFRTMYADLSDLTADKQTTRGDPRITRVGRWMRKLSLDELPQLFNVMNGTMSLVGPRPHAPNTKAADRLFAEVVKQYAVRHRVKPGITGWAQVNGWRGETTTVEQIENRVRCDLFYIDNWSLLFDIKIMAMTIVREIFSKNAF
jgi:polysaccharide biosynthesis protein PslA